MSGSVSRAALLCSQAGFTGEDFFFWVCLVLYVQYIIHSLFQEVRGFLEKRQKVAEVAVVYFPACPAAAL